MFRMTGWWVLGVVLVLSMSSGRAQYGSVVLSDGPTTEVQVMVGEGQVMEIFNFTSNNDYGLVEVEPAGGGARVGVLLPIRVYWAIQPVQPGHKNMIIPGPMAVWISRPSNTTQLFCSYKISSAEADSGSTPPNSTPTTVPTAAVVIPSDANGPIEIILESSEDMVNWSTCTPGTYGASEPKRFFRVRAISN